MENHEDDLIGKDYYVDNLLGVEEIRDMYRMKQITTLPAKGGWKLLLAKTFWER